MRVGLVSDSHNSMTNLRKAVEIFRAAGLETIFHCGDLTSVEAALQLVEFRVIYTFGNVDGNPEEIQSTLMHYGDDNFGGLFFRGELGGVEIAATHGHLPDVLDELINCGEFQYVFHGHTHKRKDVLVNSTRVINPGALGGIRFEERSCAVLDLETGVLTTHLLN